MANALIIDTETPGFAKPLQPIEVATIFVTGDSPQSVLVGQRTHQYYHAPKDVFQYGALAVHGILPQHLLDKPQWNGPAWRGEHIPGLDYVVGHNVDFDCEVLGIDGVQPRRICSLAVSRYYWPDLDAHKLGAMMYYLCGITDETRQCLQEAHSADADAENCLRILGRIVEIKGVKTWTQLYGISELGRVPYRMTFGKYGPKNGSKGMIIADMVKQDPGYVKWMKNNLEDMDPYLRKALDNPRVI